MSKPLYQNITYTYDPAGNVTHVENQLADLVDSGATKNESGFDYTYDALYRLKESQGWEHPGIGLQGQSHQNDVASDWDQTPITDPAALNEYHEYYSYDAGNNLELIDHQGTKNWKRKHVIAADSNRLSQSGIVGSTPLDMDYDANGNQTNLETETMTWDCGNNLASSALSSAGALSANLEYYTYDEQRNRARKVRTKHSGRTDQYLGETTYLEDFEVHIDQVGTPTKWHVIRYSDGKGVFSELRYEVNGAAAVKHQTLYQLTDLVRSVGIVLDEALSLVSYEEYYPFGGTSLLAGKDQASVEDQQYRYSGKEQDVSGLYYYGMRYYCSWLGRWTASDPDGTINGLNTYAMVTSNPETYYDRRGEYKENWTYTLVGGASTGYTRQKILKNQQKHEVTEHDLSWVENSSGQHALITFIYNAKSGDVDKVVTLSGIGGGNTNQQAAHTERKVAGSILLEENDEVVMFGREDPCSSCQGALAHWLYEQGQSSKKQTVFTVDYYATKTATKWTISYDKTTNLWSETHSSYKSYKTVYNKEQAYPGTFKHQ